MFKTIGVVKCFYSFCDKNAALFTNSNAKTRAAGLDDCGDTALANNA